MNGGRNYNGPKVTKRQWRKPDALMTLPLPEVIPADALSYMREHPESLRYSFAPTGEQ